MPAGTPFTGKSMTFKTGSTPAEVDHTGKWELTIGGASAKYATNSTGGWRKTTVGVGEWSGTVTVMLHAGGAQPLARGDEVAAQFHADSDDYISGTIVITEVGPITFDADSGDPVAIDYAFDGQGLPAKSGTAFDIIS
jgi:predicted secreted protein